MWLRHLHLQSNIQVKAGQSVKRGHLLGYMGNTGWSSNCHDHFDLPKTKPNPWNEWVNGKSRSWVINRYENPFVFLKSNPAPCPIHHYGYNWLQRTEDGVYHPGIDINSTPSPSADCGTPILASCDMKIHYKGYNKGFGNFIVAEQINNIPMDIYKADFVGQGFIENNQYVHSLKTFLKLDEEKELWMEFKNTGNVSLEPHSVNSVRLSCRGWNPFYIPSKWITPERISEVERFFWKNPGGIKPGQNFKFRFWVRAVNYLSEIRHYPFYLVAENVSWLNQSEPVAYMDFVIGKRPLLWRTKDNPTVWWITTERHAITSHQAMLTWFGENADKIVQTVSEQDLQKYTKGIPLTV